LLPFLHLALQRLGEADAGDGATRPRASRQENVRAASVALSMAVAQTPTKRSTWYLTFDDS
jgi:hypothetical protein